MGADGKWARVHLGRGRSTPPGWRELDRAGYSGDIALEYEVNEIEPPETGLARWRAACEASSLGRGDAGGARPPGSLELSASATGGGDCDMGFGYQPDGLGGERRPAELASCRGSPVGYDGVELPIFTPEAVTSPPALGPGGGRGRACTVSTALPRCFPLARPADRPRRGRLPRPLRRGGGGVRVDAPLRASTPSR